MNGLLGKKIGMTSIFDAAGNSVPVTVIEVEPNVITQIKTVETDGYNAVQLAAFEKREKSTTKAQRGHFTKANTTPKTIVREFRDSTVEGLKVGDALNIEDVFTENSGVDVVGISKGKGFSGVMKRHNFSGVGGRTHGQHNRDRAPGSIGQASDPSRVFKGVKMAGRQGNERVKIQSLKVVKIMSESNLILVRGSVPGSKGGYLEIHNSL